MRPGILMATILTAFGLIVLASTFAHSDPLPNLPDGTPTCFAVDEWKGAVTAQNEAAGEVQFFVDVRGDLAQAFAQAVQDKTGVEVKGIERFIAARLKLPDGGYSGIAAWSFWAPSNCYHSDGRAKLEWVMRILDGSI